MVDAAKTVVALVIVGITVLAVLVAAIVMLVGMLSPHKRAALAVIVSKVAFALSCLAVVLATNLTAMCLFAVAYWERGGIDPWGAFAIAMFAAGWSVVILLLAIVPSSLLYFRTKQRRDLLALLFAACSLAVMLIEAALVMFVIQQHGE